MLEPRSVQQIPSTDGVTVPLFDFGGEGPLLLVSHATGFHGRVYDPLIARCAGLHCLSTDLRGHGDSRTPDEVDFRWEGFADDLLAVIERLAPREPWFGFGHSMGATALLTVEQQRPGTFRALYCYEPVIHPEYVNDAQRLEGFLERTRRRRSRFPSRAAAIENYRSKPPYDAFAPDVLDAYVEHGLASHADGAVHLKCRPEVEARIYQMGPYHRAWDGLPAISCPVTIARGGTPQPGPGLWAGDLAKRLPHGRLEVFEGLGHLGPLEDPGRVAALVLTAFGSRNGSAADQDRVSIR